MHIPDKGKGLEYIVNPQKSTRKMRKTSQNTRLTRCKGSSGKEAKSLRGGKTMLKLMGGQGKMDKNNRQMSCHSPSEKQSREV